MILQTDALTNEQLLAEVERLTAAAGQAESLISQHSPTALIIALVLALLPVARKMLGRALAEVGRDRERVITALDERTERVIAALEKSNEECREETRECRRELKARTDKIVELLERGPR